MIGTWIKKIFGTSHEREIARLRPLIQKINELEPVWQAKTDFELSSMTNHFYERLDKGESITRLIPEVFATVREASKRITGMRHYDVQLIGGLILHKGAIAEMRTGEGKTLVATTPLYLNALLRRGVHLITVNDYLAKRDAAWMGKIYNFLGMSVGTVVHGQSDAEKKRAYASHITYGTNNEFGFDYLRDNMKDSIEEYVQRELYYAIVDEVDSILIDEARTPLIISGGREEAVALYHKANQVALGLRKDTDYIVDEKHHSVTLTDMGISKVEQRLGIANLYDLENLALNHHVQQALRSHTLYKRDVHYLVTEDDKVLIIDEFTGRPMPGRRWSEGLHQAVEAKENVSIEEETQTLATISFQNLFRLYEKLSGMTGTAETEAEEFHKIYKLEVVSVPPHKPMIRKDAPDLIFKNEAGKFRAIVDEISQCHEQGRPVLVGTTSVEKSETIASLLKRKGITHSVLNAKQHAREAAVVAQAGRLGSVTIATNMAGRGTDILLGGNPEFLARAEVFGEEAACQPGSFDESSIEYKEALAKFNGLTSSEGAKVRDLGGLHIVGTERHESRRIDNQLRGRAGRQGDPGSSQFYLSLEDDLMRIFGSEKTREYMSQGMEEDVPLQGGLLNRAIETAQRRVEGHNFDMRKHLLEYDDVMNQQRKAIYAMRKEILEGVYQVKEGQAGNQGEQKYQQFSDEWLPGIKSQVKELFSSADLTLAGQVKEPGEEVPIVHEVYRRFGVKIAPLVFGTRSPLESIDSVASDVVRSLWLQKERFLDLIEDVLGDLLLVYCPQGVAEEEWDRQAFSRELKTYFNVEISIKDGAHDAQEMALLLWPQLETLVLAKEAEFGLRLFQVTRYFMLREIDIQWIDHLRSMEHLREGIGLRGYGQKDPKQEYKQEGYALFLRMMERIKKNAVQNVFRVHLEVNSDGADALESKKTPTNVSYKHGENETGSEDEGEKTVKKSLSGLGRRGKEKIGRNDLCPCGSGKKYKKCHGT